MRVFPSTGMMGFMAAVRVPGSVPSLVDVLKPYAGEVMAPFGPEITFATFAAAYGA